MAKRKEEPETTAVSNVDQKLVDQAVVYINETIIETSYKGSIQIGGYILEHFFNNDINLACSRAPNKSVSFTELCKRDDLGVHPTTLSRMVRVASQREVF